MTPAAVTPSKLSLGESEAGPAMRTLTVANSSAGGITYDLSHVPALSTGGSTFVPSFFSGFANVEFSHLSLPAASVTVPAFGAATFDVTVTADPSLPERSLYGGYLVLTPEGGGQALSVPYAGFKGDYQSIAAITPGGAAALPRLVRHVGYLIPWIPRYQPETSPTYTMGAQDAGGRAIRDIPFVAVHLDHQVRELKAEVFQAGTDKHMGVAFDFEYVPRNDAATASFASTTGFFAFGWDGVGHKGPVADGNYYFRLTALKALGDRANPAHVETSTSATFAIDRP